MRRRTDGFTLVELMVVVLIIGILVAVAVPVFKAAKAKAEQNTCQANQRTLEGAFQNYVAAREAQGQAIWDQWGQVPGSKLVADGYLAKNPVCPSWQPKDYSWQQYIFWNGTQDWHPGVKDGTVWVSRNSPTLGAANAIGCFDETGHGYYLGIPEANSPVNIAGLKVWMDAANITASDGAALTSWPDTAVSGRNISGSGVTYTASGINGHPVVRFAGNGRFYIPDIRSAYGGYTVIAVSQKSPSQAAANTDQYQRLLTTWSGVNWSQPWVKPNLGLVAPGGGAAYTPTISIISQSEGYPLIGINVGRLSSWQANYFTGDLAEIMVFDRQLTSAEQGGIRAYLKAKYGI